MKRKELGTHDLKDRKKKEALDTMFALVGNILLKDSLHTVTDKRIVTARLHVKYVDASPVTYTDGQTMWRN